MLIFLKNYKIRAETSLLRNGYSYRIDKDDWIREDVNARGRFHAKILQKRVIDIHYDLYSEWRHVSGFSMPMYHNEERRRFLRKIAYARERDLYDGEWALLQKKYGIVPLHYVEL